MRYVIIAALTMGCVYGGAPGEWLRPEFAEQYGCDYEQVMESARALKEELSGSERYIPQVGWSVCELLSHNGRPYEVDHHQTAYSRSESWWYRIGNRNYSEIKLVTIDLTDAGWIVSYVGW